MPIAIPDPKQSTIPTSSDRLGTEHVIDFISEYLIDSRNPQIQQADQNFEDGFLSQPEVLRKP
jgi:hypothetical protein